MRASRINPDKQYQLIMECRSSGLSDHQWCLEHDIKPGTFYNWVKRLRQKGCTDLPSACGQDEHREHHQEVVKVNIPVNSPAMTEMYNSIPINSSCMEISVGSMLIKVPNGTDPKLLAAVFQLMKGNVC